jgi:hypothetical protein
LVCHFDSQTFTPALPHQYGFDLAALYSLQHRLPGTAEFPRGKTRLRIDARDGSPFLALPLFRLAVRRQRMIAGRFAATVSA